MAGTFEQLERPVGWWSGRARGQRGCDVSWIRAAIAATAASIVG
jgi:hypothetical protein